MNKHQIYKNIANIALIHINIRPSYIDSFRNRAVSLSTATKNEIEIN